MADVITGDSSVDNTKMDLILQIVQRELQASADLIPTISNVSAFAEKGIDKISFPKLESFSAALKVSGTAADATTLNDSVDVMDLDQHAYVQWLIEKKASKQTRLNLEAEYAKRAASAIGRNVNGKIIADMIAGADAANDVTFAGAITRDNILDMMLSLDLQNFPKDGRVFLFSPQEYRDILDIPDFTKANEVGSGSAPLFSGQIGALFGVPVVISNLISANTALHYHREAHAIGFQIDPSFDQDKDLANLAERYSVDTLYGSKVLQGGKGISKLAV